MDMSKRVFGCGQHTVVQFATEHALKAKTTGYENFMFSGFSPPILLPR
jgi:hypothetical protein